MNAVIQEINDLEQELFTHDSFHGIRELLSMTMPNSGEKEPISDLLRRIDDQGADMRTLWNLIFKKTE